MKIRVVIFRNESLNDHDLWVKACTGKQQIVEYDVIDITASDWFRQFKRKKYDLILLRPPGRTEKYKQLYDERAFILHKYSATPVYPSLNEILVYENKRFLRDWLEANGVPYPATDVFYSQVEAGEFISRNTVYPLVAKTNIGASGNGVEFLNSRREAEDYLERAFKGGISVRTGPKLKKGSLIKKVMKLFTVKGFLMKRLSEYKQTYDNPQKGYVLLQEFIQHDYEWRCVRIGDSYFAHKKIARNNKSSGTLLKGYDAVPEKLLDFIRDITERTGLSSVAVDLFENGGKYLVNEVQCFFGQSDPYQMLVDSKPGRYRFKSGGWLFEEGDFAANECYDLRLDHALELINRGAE